MKITKPFLTIEEQIQHLEHNRNLTINNSKKLVFYLSNYNFQNIINGYNDPFMKGFRRQNNQFLNDVNEDAIIELFNFDRTISNLLLSNIQNIERKFNTSFCYIVAQIMNNNNLPNGDIMNHLDIVFKPAKINNSKEILDNVYNASCNNILFKKYKKYESLIPIWTYGIYFSFGDLLKLFKNLKEEIQFMIIQFNFCCFKNVNDFTTIMSIIKNIRNRCCHNNVVYNLKIKKTNIKLNQFIESKHNKYNSIKLYDFVLLLDKVNNINKYENSLKSIFKKKIDKLLKSKNIPEICKNQILKIINYYDII